MSKIIFVLLVTVIVQTLGQPAFLGNNAKECYGKECPNTTTGCKKVVSTSDDRKTLETVIYCLDAQDLVLNEHVESQTNPFGPGTSYRSTSFQSTYVSHKGGPLNINIHNNIDPINESNIEDLA